MAGEELYAGRSSAFSKWARANRKLLPLLVDIDAVYLGRDGGLTLVELRTNGYAEPEGRGTADAVQRLADRLDIEFRIGDPSLNMGATDTSQLLWCFYTPARILGVCATTGNSWPPGSLRPSWRGWSLPPLGVWTAVADRCYEAGIPARIITCETDGSPRLGASADWVKSLRRGTSL